MNNSRYREVYRLYGFITIDSQAHKRVIKPSGKCCISQYFLMPIFLSALRKR